MPSLHDAPAEVFDNQPPCAGAGAPASIFFGPGLGANIADPQGSPEGEGASVSETSRLRPCSTAARRMRSSFAPVLLHPPRLGLAIADTTGGAAEDNSFRFHDHHHFRRFRKRVYTVGEWSSDDSATFTGIYFMEGDEIFNAFGRADEAEERYLTGKPNADGSITFDPPAKMTCK